MKLMSQSIGSAGAAEALSRLSVEIHGAVQGVGFRPFVYRLATELGLHGWVINDARGVFIEVEGPREVAEQFLARLPADIPPRALVQSLDHAWLPPAQYEQFEIRHSQDAGTKSVLILPDIATCPDCLAEIFEPADRRHGYPFTNCTNCGPRFTIIQALPYDRPNTTMGQFVMCAKCRQEYDNPLDRRFHAQPNACPVCGPQIRYWAHEGTKDGEGALKAAAEAIRSGHILAVKGLGGFHLVCDARNHAAVAALRGRKPRPDRPFAIMAPGLKWVEEHCEVGAEAAALLTSPEAPIVLLPHPPTPSPDDELPSSREGELAFPPPLNRSSGEGGRGGEVSPLVAPDNPTLGVMLPYTPLHHLLMAELGFPVVATSGNLSDEPICTDEADAVERLGHMVDGFLVHDRPIQRHADDSVAWIMAGAPRLLRRARGYAPLPVLLKHDVPPILAVGPHLKNTVSLSVGRQAFISQHIGDLETPEALAAFERVITDFLRLYEVTPAAIAHDLHPDYASTRWAAEQNRFGVAHLIPVQHHHAHLAACLAENQVEGPALGVVWDGTGFGTDGSIWGGEFLLGDAGTYQRIGHLRPFALPGGDAAVHEPRRVALALLYQVYGDDAFGLDLPAVRAFNASECQVLAQMLKRGVNAPATTSMGRLFDGVASLAGLRQAVTFEGQAAVRLEHIAETSEREAYHFALEAEARLDQPEASAPLILNWEPVVRAVLEDVRGATPAAVIAARFHNGLVRAIVEVAQAAGQGRVALTGGCFQNRLLTERSAAALAAAGFKVLLHRQTPPNDGCVSLGQLAVAATRL